MERDKPPVKAPPPAKPEGPDAVDTRLPPDPFTAVLPAIAALGAIASIAAINWSSQDKTPDRSKSKRKAQMALRELETCCMGLAEIFRRFQRHPRVFGGEGGTNAPMKFGIQGARVNSDGARGFQQVMNDVASMMVLASQNAFDVMCAIEDGEIEAPEEVYFSFGEQQERLNGLIQNRPSMSQVLETGVDVAEKLCGLVRDLKKYRIE
jgi:hypothetical protein